MIEVFKRSQVAFYLSLLLMLIPMKSIRKKKDFVSLSLKKNKQTKKPT